MHGLEAVEIRLSEVNQSSGVFRIDSEFYKKEYLNASILLNKYATKSIKEISSSIKSFGAYSLCNEIVYQDDGIPFIRCINIKNGYINFDDVLYIDNKANQLLWKSEVKPNMVLLTMSGSVGNVALAQENWNYPMNSNQDIAKIEVDSISPYFLYTFLFARYGRNQMQREQVGSVQQHVFINQIERIVVPILLEYFQTKIENVVKDAFLIKENSEYLYTSAQNLLLSHLELADYTHKINEGITIKTFANSFGTSGRIDAEYYQPRYDEIVKQLNNSTFPP